MLNRAVPAQVGRDRGGTVRRWKLLLIAGFVGVFSLLTVPFELLSPAPVSPVAFRLLAIINPAILTAVAVLLGEWAAARVGLRATLADALVAGSGAGEVLRRQLPPALLVGTLVSILLVAYGMTVGAQLAANGGVHAKLAAFDMPLSPKLLYGGVTEELLTRWALVSVFAWAGWRLSGRPERTPAMAFAVAVVLAALLFAAGHLPLLFLIAPHAAPMTIVVVLLADAVPGILFGMLFVRYGLEAAMIAHALAHLLATIGSRAFA